jgi:hypothetical protein
VTNEKKHTCGCNCERVKALERRVEELSRTLAGYVANEPRLRTLHGWDEISVYLRKPHRTIHRYAQRYGMPVFKVGRFVMTSVTALDAWLLLHRQAQRKRKERRESTYMAQYWENRAATAGSEDMLATALANQANPKRINTRSVAASTQPDTLVIPSDL